MKKAGYWSGPGPGVGTFTDTTTACKAYLRDHGEMVAFIDLYQITLVTLGTVNTSTGVLTPLVLRHAAADIDVGFEGVLYAGGGAASGWKIDRKGLKFGLGAAIESLTFSVMVDGTDFLPPADGASAPQIELGEAVHGQLLTGAHVLYRRLILPHLPTYPYVPTNLTSLSLGAITLFRGQLDKPEVSRSTIKFSAQNQFQRGAKSMPFRVYQAGCRRTLYDPLCGVSRTGSFGGYNFQFLTTISAWDASTNTATLASNPGVPDQFYTFGTLQLTSGRFCGLKLPVTASSGTSIRSLLTPPRPLTPGDSVCVQAGCDKVLLLVDPATGNISDGTCITKFNNGENFDGEPHIPPPETAV